MITKVFSCKVDVEHPSGGAVTKHNTSWLDSAAVSIFGNICLVALDWSLKYLRWSPVIHAEWLEPNYLHVKLSGRNARNVNTEQRWDENSTFYSPSRNILVVLAFSPFNTFNVLPTVCRESVI